MGGADHSLEEQNSCRSISRICREADGNETSNPGRQSGSKRRVATGFMMVVSTFQRGVQTASEHILLNLAVPLVGHDFLKPLRDTGKFVHRKTETTDSSSSMLMD